MSDRKKLKKGIGKNKGERKKAGKVRQIKKSEDNETYSYAKNTKKAR